MNKIKVIKEKSVFQHDSSDCGVACLASIIRYYGGHVSLDYIRKSSGTDKTGTTMLGLYEAARKVGMEATGYEASIADIKLHPNALILHVDGIDFADHYIASYGYEDGKFLIWDPSVGLKIMTDDELSNIWHSHKCLSLNPVEGFISKSKLAKSKINWILEMLKPDYDLLGVSAVLGITFTLLGLVMALYTQKLLDKILPDKDMKMLFVSAFLVFVLLNLRMCISAIRQLFLLKQGKQFNVRVIDQFFGRLLFLPKSFFDTRKTGDLIARLNDTLRIQRVLSEFASIYILDAIIVIVTISILFYFSFQAAILSLILLPVIFLIVKNWDKKLLNSNHEMMCSYAVSESNYIDTIKGITEIKSLNLGDKFINRNHNYFSDFQEKINNVGKLKIKLSLYIGFTSTLYIILLIIISARQVFEARLTQGEMMAVLSLGTTILPSILNISLLGIPAAEVRVAIDRMFEYIQMERENKVETDNKLSSIEVITINKVSFRFPGQRQLLNDISLKINRGRFYSLIGESGCGKSTLATIILKFYDQESGEIIVNNCMDYRNLPVEFLRTKVGYVPQEIHIFNGTILNNLLNEIDETKIKSLINFLNEYDLLTLFDEFPSGLMTLVGEEGINLSGGQKQLIAIVRVLLQKPDIVIIDEGTSSMDRIMEKRILKLLNNMKKTIGILFISHKMNIIKDYSDIVFVLNEGRIVISASPEELLANENYYRKFFESFS